MKSLVCLFLLFALSTALPASTVQRISLGSGGGEAGDHSFKPIITADGRYVLYNSSANNLIPHDTNGVLDGFLHDRITGTTERVTFGDGGVQTNAAATAVAISDNARFVAFVSAATNLTAHGANDQNQVYVHDRLLQSVTLVTRSAAGALGNNHSTGGDFSADGRYFVFGSDANNLVAGDTNGDFDVFLYDQQTTIITRPITGIGGAEANDASSGETISADGRYICFRSKATNLIATGPTNGLDHVYVLDRNFGTIRLVTAGTGGSDANGSSFNPRISRGGSAVVFASFANNLVANDTNQVQDVFFAVLAAGVPGTIERLSEPTAGGNANGASTEPAVSHDGRFVVYATSATNFVTPDADGTKSDLILVDRVRDAVERVSVATSGTQGNDHDHNPAISGNGQIVAFASDSTNLVFGDANGKGDVFIFRRQRPPPAPGSIVDLDVDGVDDEWETQVFGDTRFLAADDPDGDGVNIGDELAAGTNPFGIAISLRHGWNVVSVAHQTGGRALRDVSNGVVGIGWKWLPEENRFVGTYSVDAAVGTFFYSPQDATGSNAFSLPLP